MGVCLSFHSNPLAPPCSHDPPLPPTYHLKPLNSLTILVAQGTLRWPSNPPFHIMPLLPQLPNPFAPHSVHLRFPPFPLPSLTLSPSLLLVPSPPPPLPSFTQPPSLSLSPLLVWRMR